MKRLQVSELEEKEGRFWHEVRPFSGVAFRIHADCQVTSFEVNKGSIAGRYRPICHPTGNDYSEIDAVGQLFDYELVRYQGRPYSGIAYEFTEGRCSSEALLKGGIISTQAHWSPSGSLIYFDVPNDHFGEVYEWYDGGGLKQANISTNNEFYGTLSFSEEGALSVLVANNSFLARLQEIANVARYLPVRDVADIARLSADEKFSLSGNDIDQNAINDLASLNFFSKVKILILNNVSIEFLNIAAMPNVEEIHVNAASRSDLELLNSLKHTDRKVRVFLNGKAA